MPASLVCTPAAEPSFVQGSRFLPPLLWVTAWTSPPPTRPLSITLETLSECVYESSAGQTQSQLLITGHDLDSLVVAFEAVISNCISAGDYTQLLLRNRCFQMWAFIYFIWLNPDQLIWLYTAIAVMAMCRPSALGWNEIRSILLLMATSDPFKMVLTSLR